LQSFSLISQFFTLFCGILILFMANMDKIGSDSQKKGDISLLGWIIVLLNSTTLVFPLVRKIMTGKHIELMLIFIGVVRFPFTCYMNWCGGQKRRDARIARERAERAARHEVEAKLDLAACPLDVPSTLSAVFLEDRPAAKAAADQAADRASAMTAAKFALAPRVGLDTQPCFNSMTAELSFVETTPIEVQSSVCLQKASVDRELGFVTTHDIQQVDIASGVLVQQADDSEDEAKAGSRRIIEAVLAESMAQMPAHMRMIDYPPSLQQWYLSNKKPDNSNESPGSKRERPILQSRPWGN
jgi:hypothetical protein